MDIITTNPFRILGVYSNAKSAEIVSNCDDMEAYISIGQTIGFDLDLNNLMPNVVRSVDSVDNAKKRINLPKDKLKYALFWFFKDSSSAHALCHLKKGDFDSAKSVFEIEDTFSTLINQAVVAMIRDDLETAISYTTEMIHDDELRTAFVSAICGSTFLISEDEMAHLYIDTLLEENNVSDLMNLFQNNGTSEDDDDYLREKAIGEPISRINSEIAKAKAVKRDDAEANYKAGIALMNNTKNDLAKVKSMLGTSDMKYQMLADDLAKTILQCGINYYNNTNDDDDIENALAIQKYASKIAVGKMCKDRCSQNVAILEKKKKELPPIVVKVHDAAINASISNRIVIGGQTIDNAIAMMKECAPHIVAIKEYPELREYYLNISTQVVNAALSSVIKEHNDTLERFDNISTSSALSAVMEMLKKAWKATLMMDKFDLVSDFKNGRYAKNRIALRNMCEKVLGGYGLPSISDLDFDLRTEKELFDSCKNAADFKKYMDRYPQGNFYSQAKTQYQNLHAAEEERKWKEQQAKESENMMYNACKSIREYKDYLKKYPNGRYKWEAKHQIQELKEKNRKAGCTIAIIALILVGGIIGTIIDNSGKGFLIGCGIAIVFLFSSLLKSL
jgi:hypothetical protein